MTRKMSKKKPIPCARGRLIISFYSALKIAVTTYCTWLKPLQMVQQKNQFCKLFPDYILSP